jgi:dipeptidyl aminopeptidase/acylaminoacyl peptidase
MSPPMRFLTATLVSITLTSAAGAQAPAIPAAGARPFYAVRNGLNIRGVSPTGHLIAVDIDGALVVRHIRSGASTEVGRGVLDYVEWAPRGDRLTWFRSEKDGMGHIWTVGVNPTTGAITTPAQRVSLSTGTSSATSGDGTSIAFVGTRNASGLVPIMVVPVTGGPEREVARLHEARDLAWSGDGRSIFVGGAITTGPYALLQVYLGGRAPRVVRTDGVDWFAGATSDASRLVIITSRPTAQVLSIVDTLGRTLHSTPLPVAGQQTVYEGVIGDTALVWHTSEERRSVTIQSLANGARTTLTRVGDSDLFPVWSPDGRTIAHLAERQGRHELVLRGPDGSAVRRIAGTDVGLGPFALRWSPDSKQVLVSNRNPHRLDLVDVASGSLRTLVNDSTRRISTLTWRSDSRGIQVVMLAGGNRTLLSDLAASAIERIDLDGRRTVLRRADSTWVFHNRGFRWLNDSLVIVRSDTAVHLRTLREREGRLLARVTSGNTAANVVTTPDGRLLVIPLNGGPARMSTLEVLTTDGTRREIALPFWTMAPYRPLLSPDARTAYVAGRTWTDPGGANLYAVALDGSGVQRVTNLGGKVQMASFDLSPDGKSLLLSTAAEETSTLFLTPLSAGRTAPARR